MLNSWDTINFTKEAEDDEEIIEDPDDLSVGNIHATKNECSDLDNIREAGDEIQNVSLYRWTRTERNQKKEG